MRILAGANVSIAVERKGIQEVNQFTWKYGRK